jgi:prepilin-type N-terminal cleavage/methylation domain-containing protein
MSIAGVCVGSYRKSSAKPGPNQCACPQMQQEFEGWALELSFKSGLIVHFGSVRLKINSSIFLIMQPLARKAFGLRFARIIYGQVSRVVCPLPVEVPGTASMSKKSIHGYGAASGFSLVELLLVVAVGLILSAMAIPVARTAIASYQLDAAVDSVSGAIQGARYQAIMHGYLYQVDFNSATNQFQLSSEIPPAATFSSVGTAVPISSSPVTLGVGTTNSNSTGQVIMQFKPNGSVSVTSGQSMPLSLTISYNGATKTLTVSNYGSVSIQ